MATSITRAGGRRPWSTAMVVFFAMAASFSLTACVTTTSSTSSKLSAVPQASPRMNNNSTLAADKAAPGSVPSSVVRLALGLAAGPQAAPAAQSGSQLQSARAEGLIDQSICTKGLNSSIATSLAGGDLLAANNLGDGKKFVTARVAPVLTAADLAKNPPAPSAGATDLTDTPKSGVGSPTEGLLIAAYQQTGRAYRAGGQNPEAGFDASGFTRWVYGQRGITLPRQSSQQAVGGRQVAKEDLRPGDLLVYRDPSGQSNEFHVGIYTGQGNFLHAASKSGVVTETAAFGPQYSPFFVSGRRYLDDPKAAPLSEGQKMAAASSAVKLALSELGPNDKPERSTKKTGKVKKKKKS